MLFVPIMWVFYISLIGVLMSVLIRGAFDGVSLIFLIIATVAFAVREYWYATKEHHNGLD